MRSIEECLLCEESSSLPYYSFGAPDKVEVRNRICVRCGLVFQSPRADYEELTDYYGRYVEISQPEIAEIPYSFEDHVLGIARLRLRYIRPFLRDGDTILDIGCSFGAMLKILRDESGFNTKTLGVNPEKSLAEFGRREYGLEIREGMFEDQGFSAGVFDFIVLDNVLEHFDNPRKAIRDIHGLLSAQGKVFIATNNLSEPHGFLWQNFFPDHTVTFSPRTLKSLLEVEGFRVLDQNFAGHMTYEGYHYPYQYAIAQKAQVPKVYDFGSKGDDAKSQIEKAREYVKSYYSELGYAKKRYELSLAKDRGLFDKVKSLGYGLLGTILGQNKKFQIRNHTLPPEEFYLRRIFVSECRTRGDVNLARRLVEKSGLNPEGFIILRSSAFGTRIKLQSHGTSFLKRKLPSSFENRKNFWEVLIKNSLPIGEAVYLVLDKADLRENVIKDTYKIFRQRKGEYAFVDYRMFSNARWEFIRKERLEDSSNKSQLVKDLSFCTEEDFDRAIWPQKEDYQYYFKERFDKYYAVPKTLSLDLAPQCNKHCDKCQFHSPRSPYKHLISNNQFMEPDLAIKILEEASQWNPKPSLVPTFSGEPLIYPHLKEVLTYAKKLGFSISITTNGSALSEEKSRFLIELGIESLVVSLDAFEKDTYSILQAPGNLSKVKENLLRFLELRGRREKPSIGVHFLMEKRNQKEFDDFLRFWGSRVDFVSRAIHQDQFSNNSCTLPLWFPLEKRRACWSAWTCLYVRWNGDVSFCGFDIDTDLSGLNAREKTLSEIWKSDEFWRWRDAQLQNDFTILYCKACPDWSSHRNVPITTDKWKIIRTPLSETYFRIKYHWYKGFVDSSGTYRRKPEQGFLDNLEAK